ncbi:mitochondrial import inner membrane translocase subunit TIM17-3-like [Triticum dicoccoides]|uniref:mitochondrial import inner membrane translocase subunit TIM17-3-like n=1 Tax=Triticum dicoccoides TaxID=85692 RepID=UPI0018918B00|nr:mitochondrial import inner membrane translocase subunit TIM17-3-like [Triticum dicoccoides]
MDTSRPTTEQTPSPSIIEQVRDHAIAGAIFGSACNFVEGAWKSPSGSRLSGGVLAVPKNARSIGSCAAWFGVVQSIRCAVTHVSPEYPFESTVAWGVTDALFSMHRGPRAAARSGLMGAAIGVAFDMAEHSIKRFLASRPPREDDRRIPSQSAACPAGFPDATRRRV